MKRWYLLAILCVNVGCEFPPGISNYEANGQELNADLGFRHDSPYILIDDDPREVFTMSWIQKRKPFAKAGVQRDDIVISHGILEFYSELYKARGGTFRFQVVPGGDGPMLETREVKTIVVNVPTER